MPLVLALTVALALGLRLYQIDRESLWLDEAVSWWAAASTPAQILSLTTEDHPPVYYLVLHYWIALVGASDHSSRLLSALFGLMAVPIVFVIGRELFDDDVGLVAALFLTVSGFHIQYSQELRSYALYFLLTCLSVLCVVLLRRHHGRYALIGYTLSTTALLYTHNTAIFAVAGIVVCALVLSWPWRSSPEGAGGFRDLIPFAAATGVVALLYVPYLPVFIERASTVSRTFWVPRLTPGYTLQATHRLIAFPDRSNVPVIAQYAVDVLALTILALVLWTLLPIMRQKLVAVVLLGGVPLGLLLLVSVRHNVFLPRAFIFALLPLVLLLAMPMLIPRSMPMWRTVGLSAMTLLLCLAAAASVEFLLYNQKEPWREAAEILKRSVRPDDVQVYMDWDDELALMRYVPPSSHSLHGVYMSGDVGVHVGPHRTPAAIDQGRQPRGMAALQALEGTPGRVWFFVRINPLTQTKDKPRIAAATDWLDSRYRRVSTWGDTDLLHMVVFEPARETK